MICSHLNPGSVMHMCAGDLEDLRLLVTSRTKMITFTFVWILRLGWEFYILARMRKLGTATTTTYRPEKQRLLECFIMENLLPATNTVRNDDASNANISPAITTAVMHLNRSTASCHQTSVCVRGSLTHRPQFRTTWV